MDLRGLTEQYPYQPLDPSRMGIRLVRLLPRNPQSSWGTIIDCEIVHVSLEDKPQYEALSYAWESERKPVSIRVDGKPLAITLSLFSALTYLRGKDFWEQEPRVLWIDAICIDQSSIPERDQQVSIMREIYANALYTHVWLGDFSLKEVPSWNREWRHDFLTDVDTRQGDPSEAMMSVKDKRVIRDNLKSISERSWFSRVWVVQELACSTWIKVHVGGASCRWDALVGLVERFHDVDFSADLETEIHSNISETELQPMSMAHISHRILTLDRQRQNYQSGEASSLFHLVVGLRHLHCTDPVDRVYALVGIATGFRGLGQSMPIKYNIPVQKVFNNLINHHVMVPDQSTLLPSSTAIAAGIGTVSPQEMRALIHKEGEMPENCLVCPWERIWLTHGSVGSEYHKIRAFLVRESLSLLGLLKIVYSSSARMFLVLAPSVDVWDLYTVVEVFATTSEHTQAIAETLYSFERRQARLRGELVPHKISEMCRLSTGSRYVHTLWLDVLSSFYRGARADDHALLCSQGQYELWRHLMFEADGMCILAGTDKKKFPPLKKMSQHLVAYLRSGDVSQRNKIIDTEVDDDP